MTTSEATGRHAVGERAPALHPEPEVGEQTADPRTAAAEAQERRSETIGLRSRVAELELERDEARSEADSYAASSRVVSEVADRFVARWRDEEVGLRESLAAARAQVERLQLEVDRIRLDATRQLSSIEALRGDNDLMTSWLREIEGSRAWRAVTAYRTLRGLLTRRR